MTTTRTAPRGARMAAVGMADKGHAAAVYLRCHDAGHPNLAMGLIRRNASLAQVDAALDAVAAGQADPTPDAPPNTPPDTDARLDSQDAQLQDHETRIAALEELSPAPQGLNDGEGQTPTEARASSARPTMISTAEVYDRLSGRVAAPPMPAAIQTGPGQTLDGRAINARFNALSAARAGRTA